MIMLERLIRNILGFDFHLLKKNKVKKNMKIGVYREGQSPHVGMSCSKKSAFQILCQSEGEWQKVIMRHSDSYLKRF